MYATLNQRLKLNLKFNCNFVWAKDLKNRLRFQARMRRRVKAPWNWVGYVEIRGGGGCFAWVGGGWQGGGSDNLKWDCAIQANSSWLVFRSTPSFHSLVANILNKIYTFYINIFILWDYIILSIKKRTLEVCNFLL